MPATILDPVTALVIIDLQKGIVSRPTAHPGQEVVRRCAQLARAFRRHGLPVVLVNAFPRLGETDTAEAFLALLERRADAQ